MPSILKPIELEDFVVTAEGYAWVPQARWSPDQIEFAAKEVKKSKKLTLFSNPRCFHPKKANILFTEHSWILTAQNQDEHIRGFAYFHSYAKNRTRYGFLNLRLTTDSEFNKLLGSLLIGLIFRVTKIDLVYIYTDKELSLQLEELNTSFQKKQVLTFPVSLKNQAFSTPKEYHLNLLVCSISDWFTSEDKLPSLKKLNHIAARIDRLEKIKTEASFKRRSFLKRLFNPKVDDSLF